MTAQSHPLRVVASRSLLVLLAAGLAACSASATTGTPQPAAAQASTAPVVAVPSPASTPAAPAPTAAVSSPNAAPAATAEATAVPTSIDPCQLITAQEAGALGGTTFGSGKEETLPGNSRMCTYGAQTQNVFEVIVAIAPDVATAKKAEASAEADARANAGQLSQGLTITKFPGFAPNTDAVLMEMKPNALGIGGRAIYVLRGTAFFGFSDLVLGGAAPSATAMKAEAMTLLGKLP